MLLMPPRLQMDLSPSTTTDWSKRTLKFDSDFTGDERGTSKCLTSRDISQSIDFDISQSVDFELTPFDSHSCLISETSPPRRCQAAV